LWQEEALAIQVGSEFVSIAKALRTVNAALGRTPMTNDEGLTKEKHLALRYLNI
jgi:hypothetical protein